MSAEDEAFLHGLRAHSRDLLGRHRIFDAASSWVPAISRSWSRIRGFVLDE